jgi:hopanoid C-3 methylase
MKILLIQPPKAAATIGGGDVYVYEPLALEYVAAGVAADHDVRILDLRLSNDLQDVLQGFRPDIVGITAYTVHVNVVRRLFAEIKSQSPGVLTVVGGHHATLAPEDFISPFIDVIVIGEGVFVFRDIVERFEKREQFDDIPGIAIPNGNGLFGTVPRPSEELDAFPLPDRSMTARYRARYHSEWMRPLASIRTSKGCPYRCNFCALWKLTGGRYLRRSPAKIVEELAGIAEDFVFFADDESLIDTARMKTLAELIRTSGIRKRYFLYGRSDTIARSAELLRLWQSIGLERVFVGFEFFRDEDLAAIRKGSTSSDNEKAAKILADLGIEVYASFIVRPEFTKEDFAKFAPYCESLGLRFATFAVLTPLPGTDLYQEVKDRLITHNYDFVDFLHTLLPTTLPLKDFYEELYGLYQRAIPFRKRATILGKYPLKEIPSTLATSHRILKRLRTAYLDYGPEALGNPSS